MEQNQLKSATPATYRADGGSDVAGDAAGEDTAGELNWHWAPTLFAGVALFLAFAVVLFLTSNPNLYPTVILIGNALVPIVFVSFLYSQQHGSKLNAQAFTRALILGGLLGTLGASILEPLLIRPAGNSDQGLTLTSAMVVGLIEEGCKALALIWLARRMRHDSELDGLLLGTAVGMGFAALESTGYAFTVFLLSSGNVAASLVETVIRGLVAPFGHGVWTGILGAMLFRHSSARHFHLNLAVLFTYMYVSVLHGLWDGLPRITYINLPAGLTISVVSLTVSVVGVGTLVLLFRDALTRQLQESRSRRPAAQPVPQPVPQPTTYVTEEGTHMVAADTLSARGADGADGADGAHRRDSADGSTGSAPYVLEQDRASR